MQNSINVLDLFCGAGGFSHGITQANVRYNIVGGIDMNEQALKTFEKNHNCETICGDISDLSPARVQKSIESEVDLIIGGPPCQGFSTIGDREEGDYRNYLYKDYIRFVEYFQPELFVMENVPDILNHEDGDIFEELLVDIKETGYKFEWALLNASYYGVPQARSRFILIARKEGNVSMPTPTHYWKDTEKEQKMMKFTQEMVQPNEENIDEMKEVVSMSEAVFDLVNVESGEENNEYKYEPKNHFQEIMQTDEEKLSWHTATNHSSKSIERIKNAGFKKSDLPDELMPNGGFEQTYSKMYPHRPSTIIKTKFTSPGNGRYIHPYENRCITVREGARLQSFRDDYEFIGTKTDVSKQIGNAVPPLLARAIGQHILNYF